MNRLLDFLCSLGIHQIPEEKRRWTDVGWIGYCTRCGTKRTGLGRAAR